MYQVSIPVTARVVEPEKRIVFDWPGAEGTTSVELTFESHSKRMTFIDIVEKGFTGRGDELVKQVADSTEHGISLNLVRDRFPAGLDAE
jgi:uncharacterized protein YndB with AHSA1/START domain